MVIGKTNRWKWYRECDKWAKENKEKIMEIFNNKCNKCPSNKNLTMHFKKYEKSFDCVEVLCQRCHRKFHNKEFKKKFLILILKDIEKFKGNSLKEYREDLKGRIEKIKVKIVTGLNIDGIPF